MLAELAERERVRTGKSAQPNPWEQRIEERRQAEVLQREKGLSVDESRIQKLEFGASAFLTGKELAKAKRQARAAEAAAFWAEVHLLRALGEDKNE
jgi:hypothetical protein